ncbi:hypothetical protein BGW38_007963 [Lunasporangiospora selenospora]|uniref:GRIP domain-containing protein n=1 Tax=Lunasporangiospora selenospora TaxID=979761 RepID=A0A9P6KGP8_9FUNG|nr:hypothetical protein BGW38_007963 [Lunasporangiospora selenospora]
MAWLAKNVSNLASRIAAEANGEQQQVSAEEFHQLHQQLQNLNEEFHVRSQEWEQARQNYESRLKSLTEGNATAQKVEQLEQKLQKAAELLRKLSGEKTDLKNRIVTLEDERTRAESLAAEAAAREESTRDAHNQEQDGAKQLQEENNAKILELEQLLENEHEQYAKQIEHFMAKLEAADKRNKELEATVEKQQAHQRESSDNHADLSIQLEMTKEELENAKEELAHLKETNSKLASTPKSDPAQLQELSEAKATIAELQSRLLQESEDNTQADAAAVQQKELEGTIESLREELAESKVQCEKVTTELSSSKQQQDELESKIESLHGSVAQLQSELTSANTASSESSIQSNGSHDDSAVLQDRIRTLEQELKVSKESLTEQQLDAVTHAIKSVLDSNPKGTLPKLLATDKTVAAWNRTRDEFNSYKDGNRSLEESLSKLRQDHLVLQETTNATVTTLESKHAEEMEAIRQSHTEAVSKLEQEHMGHSASHEEFNKQLGDLKLSEEESRNQLLEQFEEERMALQANNAVITQELDTLTKKSQAELLAVGEALKERDSKIQELEWTAGNYEQTMQALRDDLQRTVNERNQFQSQHKSLLDRVSSMKSTLGTKLQADLENINTLRQKIDQLTGLNSDYLNTIKQLEEELMASHEHYEKTSRELEHLRRRLVDIQEEASAEVVEKEGMIHELQSRLQREEREREDWETMASEQRASKDQAAANMRSMERERDAARAEREALKQELENEIISLNNLQAVLEEFQATKESDIQFALEGIQRQLNVASTSLEEFKSRALSAEEQLQQSTMDSERVRQLERDVKEKNLTIGKLRHDAFTQQGHLVEAMRRLKEEKSQNMVDISLISNLFIRFLSTPRGDQKRFEILQLISGVLNFTDEQREQAGLIRKAGSGLGAMTPSTSGSRSPSMEQMRQQEPREPLQIHWHDKQPIYSAHFEPGTKGRLATAGGDGNVRIWKVVKDKDSTHIEFLSSLNRHTAAVNVVRFSPTAECLASAGDDGNIILWRPSETKDAANRFAESDDEEYQRESWRVQSMMRGSLSDIYDLAWSPDGRYIISGSIDNTARIWDVKDAKCIHVIADHHHYVQGVAWDPLGEFVATQSSDRSVHIYAFRLDKNGHVAVTSLGRSTKIDFAKMRSAPSTSKDAPQENPETDMAVDSNSGDKDDTTKATTPTSKTVPKSFRLYHDETLTSFFRRLSFTPDGSMLLTPAGQYKAPNSKSVSGKDDDASNSAASTEMETRNTVYVYARKDFSRGPVAHLPGFKRPSVAIKCSPVLYNLRPLKASPAFTETNGHGSGSKPSSNQPPSVFGLGYRAVYAVATQDSVLIYDTQQTTALALVSHIHYATFTDMTWSSDGCNLILTSSDGFCSIISFEEGELGSVYKPPTSKVEHMTGGGKSSALVWKDSLDASVAMAATAGMLHKLKGLSLEEYQQLEQQKEGKENKESKESKSKAKQQQQQNASSEKTEAANGSSKKGAAGSTKKAGSKAARSVLPSASNSSTLPCTKPATSKPKSKFKTEKDGDALMEAPTKEPPKQRKRKHQSALGDDSSSMCVQPTIPSTVASPLTSGPSTPAVSTPPASGGASPMVFGSTSTTEEEKPKKKRIQPIFVSALPGYS